MREVSGRFVVHKVQVIGPQVIFMVNKGIGFRCVSLQEADVVYFAVGAANVEEVYDLGIKQQIIIQYRRCE